ncbi:PEP/pyruvate-binding domain-containing protein [Allorhizocola rhizosphaerae]|uniref:PEP/pyruvate-binding domain-containing protein n=1 Tax=Allorhizocola rhizosphaerae TaxID=1872709 RepID=UPI000E3D3157|nr:PEP/pyruvate-binding domain-containing protein [Allorhizocola rhizosphaerae]
MTLVAPLDAFGRADLALAGGKGANLGELIRAGFPVPAGFVVTTDAYAKRATDAHAQRATDAHAEEATDAHAEEGADAYAKGGAHVPDPLRHAIAQAYASLGGGPVAVRSSATAEDLPGAAFAGQQDTYLNVVGEEALIDAVRRCWDSLWTERAVAYRRRLGIDDREVSIAVVVQRMVEAEMAGVMFTADPVTGDRGHVVIDASSGLGEAVVSGLVTPDHYVLDARGRVREFTPGRREVVVKAKAGGGVIHETGGTELHLPDEALKQLAHLGQRVQVHFGRPQDIEWAYTQKKIVLLQARPMTALPPPPLKLNRIERRIGSVLLEYLPVRPYPIDTTTWLPHGPAGLMNKIAEHFGIRGPFEGFLPEEDGVVVRMVPRAPRPTLGIVRGLFRFVRLARRYDPAHWTEDPRFREFLSRARDLGAQDLTTMTWQRLLQVPRQALALVEPVTDFRTRYLPAAGLALLRLFLALKRLGRADMLGDLIAGARTRTTDANRALEDLAQLMRLKGDFAARFASFLEEYGHRETTSPILVSPPTWAESPETVLGLIKVLAAKAPEPAKPVDDALARLLEHPRLRDPKRRQRIQRLVEQARAGIAFREDSHFYFTKPLPILRRCLLEIGRRLSEVDVLVRPEDVFHLRLEEIEAIGLPAGLSESEKDRLRAIVRQRAAKRDELAGVRLIDPRAVFPATDRGDALVAGAAAGGGIVTGPVKVVRDPAEFGKLESGDVLVCPYTNPSWTPLFQRAAAVVVDSGGIASHAAIVAREYGIPAVMGTATGTSTLVDGQVVTVDGDTGRVTAHGD